jgi:transposase
MRVWCGIDWAGQHHDVCLVDDNGGELARRRISNDVAGFTALAALLAEHGVVSDEPVPVAIETAKPRSTAGR